MGRQFLSDEQLADLLGISVRGLRNKVVRGDPLPPHCRLPGLRIRLWPEDGVVEWIENYQVGALQNSELSRGRGRPSKFPRKGVESGR